MLFNVRIFLFVSCRFLRDLMEEGGGPVGVLGVCGISSSPVNLSVMVVGRPQQDCLTSIQGRPVQHVNSSIDRCPIRASSCDWSCMLMSCSRQQNHPPLINNFTTL